MSDIDEVIEEVRQSTMTVGDGESVVTLLRSFGVDEAELGKALISEAERYLEAEFGGNPRLLTVLREDFAAFGLHMFCVGFAYGRATITV